jgi:hypothetical protein
LHQKVTPWSELRCMNWIQGEVYIDRNNQNMIEHCSQLIISSFLMNRRIPFSFLVKSILLVLRLNHLLNKDSQKEKQVP